MSNEKNLNRLRAAIDRKQRDIYRAEANDHFGWAINAMKADLAALHAEYQNASRR